MYNPAPRTDGRNLEFIELFNSEADPQSISPASASPATVDFTFPAGTTLPARGYLVVAAVPADLQAVHGINVSGPYTNNLPNSSGLLRLRNPLDAVLLEIEYSDASTLAARRRWRRPFARPRPALLRRRRCPRLGRQRPGRRHPGRGETPAPTPTAPSSSTNSSPIPTCPKSISSSSTITATSRRRPLRLHPQRPPRHREVHHPNAGTTIPAKGFVAFTETQLGFALSTLGETIYLKNPAQTPASSTPSASKPRTNGVATGRYPDGAPTFHELTTKTPNAPNAKLLIRDVVINELMFNPISGDDDDEFVELHNRGASPANLGGWRFTDGIISPSPQHRHPRQRLPRRRQKRDRLLANYPNLNTANTVGNYSGTLANSGERIALARVDTTTITNNNVAVTKRSSPSSTKSPTTTAVAGPAGPTAAAAHLELIDPSSDNRLGANWADSDESSKSTWTTIEHTGVLDNGNGASDELHIMLLGAGECLIDNLEVFASGGPNRVPNGTFESGLDGWVIQGNHVQSKLRTTEGYASSRSLHLRASAGGDNGANRAKIKLSSGFSSGQTVTIRAQARWLRHTNLFLRLKGNYLEAAGTLAPPSPPSALPARQQQPTPRQRRPRHPRRHHSPRPAHRRTGRPGHRPGPRPRWPRQPHLIYRVDPSTNTTTISMVYNGAGFYSATIPGQSAGTLVAFHIQATDAHPTAPASTRFPDDAPGPANASSASATPPPGTFGIYRLWMTQANIDTWASREKLSNEALDGTFVYGNSPRHLQCRRPLPRQPLHPPRLQQPGRQPLRLRLDHAQRRSFPRRRRTQPRFPRTRPR
jgi:hypothetical protein